MNSQLVPFATLYQPPWWNFIGTSKVRELDSSVSQKSFLSFEDALWSLCQSEELRPGSRFLIPDFYCMEVVAQIEARGWSVSYYSLESFRVQEQKLSEHIQKLRPAVVILYHPFGLSCIPSLPESPLAEHLSSTLIIEDCAHRLLDPSQVVVQGDRHILIDSLRKVSPFQGGRIFTLTTRKQALESSFFVLTRFNLMLLYVCWRCVLQMSTVVKFNWLWRLSEELFSRYNNAIGGSSYFFAGPMVSYFVTSFINVARVKEKKAALVAHYYEVLRGHEDSMLVIPQEEWQELKCFPLILDKARGLQLIEYLQVRGVDSDDMFSDAPACKEFTVVMLPISIKMSPSTIQRIGNLVSSFLSQQAALPSAVDSRDSGERVL